MKYSKNPLRYLPIFDILYTFLDFYRFRKQILQKFHFYKYPDNSVLLMRKKPMEVLASD